MNILITGLHGFVGSNLTESLKKQHVIYGLDIVAPDKPGVEKTFSWTELEEGKLPEAEVIIHLAGKAHDTKTQSDAESYFAINTGLTQKIYNHFLASGAKKFIFFSSVKAAADTVRGEALTEEVVPSPVGPYGESKIRAEQYLQAHWPDPVSGKSVFILRPCMIHGPGNKGNLNLLFQAVHKGIPWPLGAFENRRSFTSVENLCYVMDQLICRNIEPGIYNMADDEAISTNELIEIICKTLRKKPRIWHIAKELMTGLAGVGGTFHLPLNKERLSKLTENYVVSNTKIKAALGISSMPVSTREGLQRTLAWMRDADEHKNTHKCIPHKVTML